MHDVDVFLTTSATDSKEETLSGPLSGRFCPTYDGINSMANLHQGNWADWEPYRCTFEFGSEVHAMEFIHHVGQEYPDSVNIEYVGFRDWDN